VVIIAAVAVCSAATATSADGADHAAIPASHRAGSLWHKISTGQVYSIAQPGLHRFGKTLDVVWVQGGSQCSASIVSRLFNARSGAAVGAPHSVLPNKWTALNCQVAIVPTGKQRTVFFSGIRNPARPSDPYNEQAVYFATSNNGSTWKLQHGSASQSKLLGSTGVAAVATPSKPYVGFDVNGDVRFHHGVSSTIPANTPDGHPARNPKCCAVHPGIGRDAKTGTVWEAWWDESGVKGWDGINAQPISRSAHRFHAPSSSVTSGSSSHSVDPDQGVQVAGRPKGAGGGAYTAYAIGWPSAKAVGVWRLGAKRLAIKIKSRDAVRNVGIAPGRGGRLWIYWVDAPKQQIDVALTNPQVTRIGKVRSFRNPHPGPGNGPECLVGDGTAGPLDLVVVNAGSPTAVYLGRIGTR
jgi:hypothetical protein